MRQDLTQIYGQSAFFDDFSLNDSDFAKCSAARQLPAQLRFEILSTFEAARAEFGPAGRQKSHISLVFCLLLRPREPNLDSPVDKNQTFPPFFVYFRGHTGRIWIVR